MDLILVQLPNLKRDIQIHMTYSPDSLLSLGSYLDWCGFRVKILDLRFCVKGGPPQDEIDNRPTLLARLVSAAIREEAPHLLGFTSLTNGDGWAVAQTAALVKQEYPNLLIVLGGYFPTCNGQAILEECPAIDAIVVGEGEVPTASILRRLAGGMPAFSADVPSLCFRDGARIVSTPRAALFDLSSAPPLNFALLEHPEHYQALSYHTSRNCPWRCSYCLETSMGTRYRTKPLELVRRDVLEFKNLNRCFLLYLADPILSPTDHRTTQLCELLGSLNVVYAFETRCDTLSPELLPLLKQSGCESMYLGLESASYDTLLRMNKIRPADFDTYQKYLSGALAITEAAGQNSISIAVGAMLGYPGDTLQDLAQTLEFCRRLRDTYRQSLPGDGCSNAFGVIPLNVFIPRTSALWKAREYFVRKGLQLADTGLFGDHRVIRASSSLDEAAIQAFAKEANAITWGVYGAGIQ